MGKSASKRFDFRKFLINPARSIKDKGWDSPFSSSGLVVGLFVVGLLVGFVGIPQLKARIFSSPTLSLRSEAIDGLKVTSDLPSDVTKQAVDFLKSGLKPDFLPGQLLIGKPAVAANATGQEYVALWNSGGKSWTLLVVVPDSLKKAIYLRTWYTGPEQNFEEASSRGLLSSVFNDFALGSSSDIKCQAVDDAAGKAQVCGVMLDQNGEKKGALVRGSVKVGDTKNGTAVALCLMTNDHPAYKGASYCP
jgi:hypothetical protein